VPAGEQVTVSYIDADEIDQNVVERRKYLQEKWGFECDCVKCREDLRKMQIERENRLIVHTLANKKITDLVKEQKRVLLEQRNNDQHGREKRAKNRHTATVAKMADLSKDSQNIGALVGKFLHAKSALHSQTPTTIPVLPPSYVQEESLSPPSMSSLWQNTEFPSSSIEMSSPLHMNEYDTAIPSDKDNTSPFPEYNPASPEHMLESPPSRQNMEEPPHSTEHMQELPPAHVDVLSDSAEQASVVQPVKQPIQELVPVASGNTPTKIGANCVDELWNFLNWCQGGLISFWQNADVFTIMSCLIAMRVRYRYIEKLDTTQQAKVALSSEIHGCFTSFYQKICLLFTSDESYANIPAAGLSMYAYDSLFCSQTLASCVHEIAGISMIAYSPHNHQASQLLRVHYCHITRGWFHCLKQHLTCIENQLTAISQKKPPRVELIQLPAHIRHPLTQCLVPSQTVWIRILMAACTHVIKQLDENTKF